MIPRSVHRNVITLAMLAPFVAAAAAQQRTWTDNTGKFSVEAELAETKQDTIVLKKTDGELITVPVTRLSETDRRYLQSLAKPGSGPPIAGPGYIRLFGTD